MESLDISIVGCNMDLFHRFHGSNSNAVEAASQHFIEFRLNLAPFSGRVSLGGIIRKIPTFPMDSESLLDKIKLLMLKK